MPDMRSNIVATALAHVVKNKNGTEKWNYGEVRPIPYHSPLRFPLTTDCSGFVSLCFYENGCYDPNQSNYDGQGYTGSLMDHGTKIERAAVVPGDVVVYGAYPGQHTALIVRVMPNGDILTASHGEQGDPSLVWAERRSGDTMGHAIDTRPALYFRFRTAKRGLIARLMGKK